MNRPFVIRIDDVNKGQWRFGGSFESLEDAKEFLAGSYGSLYPGLSRSVVLMTTVFREGEDRGRR